MGKAFTDENVTSPATSSHKNAETNLETIALIQAVFSDEHSTGLDTIVLSWPLIFSHVEDEEVVQMPIGITARDRPLPLSTTKAEHDDTPMSKLVTTPSKFDAVQTIVLLLIGGILSLIVLGTLINILFRGKRGLDIFPLFESCFKRDQ